MENLKKILAVLIAFGNSLDKSFKTQGALAKASCFLDMADELFALTGVSFSEAVKEFKNLDTIKKQELLDYFAAKFDIANDKVEAKIEAGLILAIECECLIEKVVIFAKTIKE